MKDEGWDMKDEGLEGGYRERGLKLTGSLLPG